MASNYYPLIILALLLLFLTVNSTLILLQTQAGRNRIIQTIDNIVPSFIKIDTLFQPIKQAIISFPGNDSIKSFLPPFISGNSRFSRGMCLTDQDCFPAGCSGEICTSQTDITSTCEWSDSFPNAQGYSCQCVYHFCGWMK